MIIFIQQSSAATICSKEQTTWRIYCQSREGYAPSAAAAAAAKSLPSCPTLCDPIGSSPSGSPVPGILQARTLEWVVSFSNAWKWKMKVKSLSHVWLSDPMDCSLQASSIHGICQARVLEWVAIAFSNAPSSAPKFSTGITGFRNEKA